MMQQTSLIAYHDIQPTLGGKRLQVYRLLQSTPPLTNKQIASLLGWPINCVTGRVKELREKPYELVKAYDEVIQSNGRPAKRWTYTEYQNINILEK